MLVRLLYLIALALIVAAVCKQCDEADAAEDELKRRREAWDQRGHWP